MRPGQRFGLSEIEKRGVWSRWKAGQSLHEIGRAFDKPHSCIRSVLLPRGRIPPAARRRSRLALTLAEREDISRGIPSLGPPHGPIRSGGQPWDPRATARRAGIYVGNKKITFYTETT